MQGLYRNVQTVGIFQRRQILSVQTKQTRLIRLLLYGFWIVFFAVYLTSELVRFASCLHPLGIQFPRLIDNHLSRKATLMFQGVLLFEFFQRTYLIFCFHLNQVGNFPDKTYAFFRTSQQPISVQLRAKKHIL